MYVCMYVCIYVCRYVCMYVCRYVCLYRYIWSLLILLNIKICAISKLISIKFSSQQSTILPYFLKSMFYQTIACIENDCHLEFKMVDNQPQTRICHLHLLGPDSSHTTNPKPNCVEFDVNMRHNPAVAVFCRHCSGILLGYH